MTRVVSGGEALEGGVVEAAVGQADVAGVDLNAGTFFRGNEEVGALLTGLAGSVADEEREGGLRVAIEEFAHEAHTEKAGCAGDEDQFIVHHSGTDLRQANNSRAGRQWSIGYPGDEKVYAPL